MISRVVGCGCLIPPNGQLMHVMCGKDRQCMCGPKGDADGTEWRFVQTFARATLAMSCAAHSSECRPGVTCHRVCRTCLGLLMPLRIGVARSEEHTSELQSLMRISYAVFCLKKKNNKYLYSIYKYIYQQTEKQHSEYTINTEREHQNTQHN